MYRFRCKELWNLDSHQACCYKGLPSGRKTIRCKWVFRVKYKSDKIIKRYKAWLVAQRFSQVPKMDFTEIFAATIRQHRKILYGPNPNGGSKILLIHRNPPLSALNPPLSTFPNLNPTLILVRAGLWIFEYTEFDWIFGSTLD